MQEAFALGRYRGSNISSFIQATAAKTMAAQICYLKRQLAFSAEEFVDVWLHHLQEPATTAWPLTAYRHLGCATLDALSLTLVVQRSEKSWFILQCRLLEDDDLLQGKEQNQGEVAKY